MIDGLLVNLMLVWLRAEVETFLHTHNTRVPSLRQVEGVSSYFNLHNRVVTNHQIKAQLLFSFSS